VPLLELQHLLQGELRADVRVEDKEGLSTTRQDLVSEVIDAASRAQRRVLLEIPASRAGKSEGLGKQGAGGTARKRGREGLAGAGQT